MHIILVHYYSRVISKPLTMHNEVIHEEPVSNNRSLSFSFTHFILL